ncbi:hypothetical protein JDV02_005543 [Purpureocillium takamizusanense]|uniref:Adenine DNA glycosylase n=1 Tax=Purpureocillium takamizusanense TaxID=2060973 RepID=A0A9Q8VBW0_9HYPO|nr:uncharacterized protein JDV02_005543 [Purpureocillium takamizusanense]UNI19356.1 hypothetical protein JDV02_005543 [Purpureocillium takamizusanense]
MAQRSSRASSTGRAAGSSRRGSKGTASRSKTRRGVHHPPTTTATTTTSTTASDDNDGYKDDDGEYRDNGKSTPSPRPAKRRKVASSSNGAAADLHRRLFARDVPVTVPDACLPPARRHSLDYHKPLLLSADHGLQGRSSLLSWFDSVSATRAMPWRKPWINPRLPNNDDDDDNAAAAQQQQQLRARLERRAYEVWISEIMLQQTRVAVVIDYWNRWTARWPTIHDLARASPDDVLAAWRGLGYYSRATRIHEAARLAVADPRMRGLLPSSAAELQARVPGVGRYTAGAISSIVFGRPEPMVDGNVLRVLSRQLGVHANVKTDRAVVDAIWVAADALVKAVAEDNDDDGDADEIILDGEGARVNDRPGRWGQALMELGSTVCTPKPDCAACPITTTCRAYAEGMALADNMKETSSSPRDAVVADIEDACTLCKPMEEDEGGDVVETKPQQPAAAARKQQSGGAKQLSLADFAFKVPGGAVPKPESPRTQTQAASRRRAAAVQAAAEHARKFPLKVAKKAVREEQTLVCAIRRPDGSYLLERRPEKGLLAGLWEFPSLILDDGNSNDDDDNNNGGGGGGGPHGARRRTELAEAHAAKMLSKTMTTTTRSSASRGKNQLRHLGELGSVPWLFSHLRLTMHVHLFAAPEGADYNNNNKVAGGKSRPLRWSDDVDGESMGTGMHKCWALVKGAAEG